MPSLKKIFISYIKKLNRTKRICLAKKNFPNNSSQKGNKKASFHKEAFLSFQ